MNIIKKIFNRLKAECVWAKWDSTHDLYIIVEIRYSCISLLMWGGKYQSFVIWQLYLSTIQR